MKLNYKYLLIALVLFIILAAVFYALFWSNTNNQTVNNNQNNNQAVNITNYEECVAAGNQVIETYPAKCQVNGQTFTQDIGNQLAKQDKIMVDKPSPNQEISSPLSIIGEARGTWFFEASFPVELYDDNDQLLGQAIAQAQAEWMTEDFIPFEAEIEFNENEIDTIQGKLILKNDNPSGLPQNDDKLIIPVKFKK